MNRRTFIKVSLAAASVSGGLLLGFNLVQRTRLASSSPTASTKASQQDGVALAPNAFLRIGTDNTVTVILHKAEMGQGVYTSLPMLVAEELEADWESIRVEMAPAHPDFYHTAWGPFQGTGASTSVTSTWEQLRTTGAVAREMLIAAAARQWGIPMERCQARQGLVRDKATGRQLSYGELAILAAQMPVPEVVALKEPKDFKIIGSSVKRLDSEAKITGTAEYGIDVTLPGMLTAVILRPPVFGAKAKSLETGAAMAVKGVRHVVVINEGVAVVADNFWAAKKGRDALDVKWDPEFNHNLSTQVLREKYAALARTPGRLAHEQGHTQTTNAATNRHLMAEYELPYLAHAPMEPLNCVAHVQADGCDIWTGTQMQTTDQKAAAEITGHDINDVRIHTTFLGGSFGRRANPHADYVREAVQVSKTIGNLPVKVIWTREDDIRGGYYRPMHFSRLEAELDKDGYPVVWRHRLIGESIVKGTPFEKALTHDGIDHLSVEGAADHPYHIANQRIEYHPVDNGVPVLWWRSVGHSFTAFAVESFIDEIATAAGHDPYTLRMHLLKGHSRHQRVLKMAAEKAGWGGKHPAGMAQGLALHKSFKSIVAQVAEVKIEADGSPTVTRVVCVVDCGLAVDPQNIRAQMQSGIVYGLSALYEEITFKEGRVQQSNFHDYPALRMDKMPKIEVYILETGTEMGGIGEVGTPPVAPAVCNAIYAATGKRLRRLPINQSLHTEA
ncbi:xanthine dehydrogenase family protein molybdopterin-binding subunit [Sulfuriflexus mobilis]|uniref:xanthine dehydrogenase family protein molybdopterin-binding subunit n=1 Tax=Sulfuriflexus mobilis TaxID=1811807 RepID=UPI000F835989|nr:xanthine dehydrogenase family protein molybdopterin-binding subunit [Sulfuriflexus mobilis]